MIKYWPDLNYSSVTATLGFVTTLLLSTYNSWDFIQRGYQLRNFSKQFVKYSDKKSASVWCVFAWIFS
jgi:hypothetical protein